MLLPLIAHSIAYVLHSVRGTPALGASIAASVTMTLISTTFHLLVMRRGVLLTGVGEQSLFDDLNAVPRLSAVRDGLDAGVPAHPAVINHEGHEVHEGAGHGGTELTEARYQTAAGGAGLSGPALENDSDDDTSSGYRRWRLVVVVAVVLSRALRDRRRSS